MKTTPMSKRDLHDLNSEKTMVANAIGVSPGVYEEMPAVFITMKSAALPEGAAITMPLSADETLEFCDQLKAFAEQVRRKIN